MLFPLASILHSPTTLSVLILIIPSSSWLPSTLPHHFPDFLLRGILLPFCPHNLALLSSFFLSLSDLYPQPSVPNSLYSPNSTFLTPTTLPLILYHNTILFPSKVLCPPLITSSFLMEISLYIISCPPTAF